jgi:hypothetical protein
MRAAYRFYIHPISTEGAGALGNVLEEKDDRGRDRKEECSSYPPRRELSAVDLGDVSGNVAESDKWNESGG